MGYWSTESLENLNTKDTMESFRVREMKLNPILSGAKFAFGKQLI